MVKIGSDFSVERYGLIVRLVNEGDAAFIVKLRTNERLGRYLNKTSPNVDDQIEWIKRYKHRESAGEDFYFVFEKPKGISVGLCRIYDIKEGMFSIGSWLFSPEAPAGAAILADIITREIAFELFPESELQFEVRKQNETVIRYQKTFKPIVVAEDDLNIYFALTKQLFDQYKETHLRMFAPKIK